MTSLRGYIESDQRKKLKHYKSPQKVKEKAIAEGQKVHSCRQKYFDGEVQEFMAGISDHESNKIG